MPPKGASRKRAAATEEYDNDGGFVEDAPKSKKSKQTSNSKAVSGKQEDEEGNEYWEVSIPSSSRTLSSGIDAVIAVTHKAHTNIGVQGRHHGEHTRVLRKG